MTLANNATLSVRCNDITLSEFKARCEANGVNYTDVVRWFLDDYIQESEKQSKTNVNFIGNQS